MKKILESGGDQMVAITRRPFGNVRTIFSALRSILLRTLVSRYMSAKKARAQTAKPARCHLLGGTDARTQMPITAVIVVSRAMIMPMGAEYIGTHNVSGIRAAQSSRRVHSSSALRNLHLSLALLHCRTTPATKAITPNAKTAIPTAQ